ncbi:uncharacterized protein At5g41620-like [Vigna unguiculata]|uniref:uncharacterized protein At5g41620-like n=1 Tax=Vigna unguiculata TaxID=3917 RepID=UPI001016D4C3|nr:uncharacterized protein At5g41620-like [Vigna unguiculata]
MERREDKRGGLMVEKLREGVLVGKKGGPSTPPPTWRLELPSQYNGSDNVQEFLNFPTSSLSARKLCANLWELLPHQQQHTPPVKMNKLGTNLSRRRRNRRRLRHPKDTASEVNNTQLAEPPDTPSGSDQPASSSSSRSVAASFVRHRTSVRNGCDLQPASPACYSSSSEEAASYTCAVTPKSSVDFKGRNEESRYNLKTSTELLKVLNRIWSLEEQQASSMSVVKTLKTELDRSQARIKELTRDKQMNRQEMQNLIQQLTVDKLIRKNKEHGRIKAAVQSIKEELEDERRLRQHSESLHRKLAREISEVKSSFSGCLRNLERERKARILLENLCDEFAKGIRDYEQEVHSLRRSSEKGQIQVKGNNNNNNSLDRLILHISEAWLDERMQMKLAQSDSDLIERNSIVDKLGFDIETFLHARRSVDLKKYGYSSPKELTEIHPCEHSLEGGSAPQNMGLEDSIDDFFEPKRANGEGLHKLSSSLQSNMDKNMSYDTERFFVHRKSSEMGEDNIALLNEDAKHDQQESDRPWILRMNSSHRPDILVGNSSLSSEGDKIYPDSICKEDYSVHSAVTTTGSPGKLWKPKFSVSDYDKPESCSSKLPAGVKENTLMAKLLEARLEAQRSRCRASKSTS